MCQAASQSTSQPARLNVLYESSIHSYGNFLSHHHHHPVTKSGAIYKNKCLGIMAFSSQRHHGQWIPPPPKTFLSHIYICICICVYLAPASSFFIVWFAFGFSRFFLCFFFCISLDPFIQNKHKRNLNILWSSSPCQLVFVITKQTVCCPFVCHRQLSVMCNDS